MTAVTCSGEVARGRAAGSAPWAEPGRGTRSGLGSSRSGTPCALRCERYRACKISAICASSSIETGQAPAGVVDAESGGSARYSAASRLGSRSAGSRP